MDIGVLAPQVGRNSGRVPIRDVAQAADELGFASVWVTDHLMVPAVYSSSYPYRTGGRIEVVDDQPYYEMITTLGYLAAVTERVTLGTAVGILPYRHPLFLAKALASLDQLCEGRFIFGAGVGWLREEFDALGVDFTKRGKYTDEIIEFLRTVWTPEQPVSFHGEFVNLEPSLLNPRPYQDRRIPFWIGGESKAAYRRLVQHGDGWFPHVFNHTPEAIRSTLGEVATMRAEAGKTEPLDVGLFVPLYLTDAPEDGPLEPWKNSLLKGDVDQVRAVLADYQGAGVTHVLLMFGGRTDRRIEWMTRLQSDVLAAL